MERCDFLVCGTTLSLKWISVRHQKAVWLSAVMFEGGPSKVPVCMCELWSSGIFKTCTVGNTLETTCCGD